MNNDILSNTENIDQTVSAFAAELNEYIDSMEQEIVTLSGALAALGNGWEMDDYHKFSDNMNLKIKKIKAELERSKELKAYLDETAQDFKELLKILSDAAE